VDIKILQETQIETYDTPGHKVKQEAIIFQAEGMAPQQIWLDSEKIPDVAYQLKNPGKPVPPDIQTAGDKVRRAAIEAKVNQLKAVPGPRSI
jgi:hypothetical protein